MDRLPTEILRLICAYVRDSDHDYEDFYSLTLVNHRFYETAVPLIYETLNVRFSDYASLAQIVTEIKENPRRQQYLIHARRLNLMAIPDIQQQGYGGTRLTTISIGRPDENVRPRDLIPRTFGSPGFFFDRYLTQVVPPNLEWTLQPGIYKEKNWEPLISLMGSMTCLKEIHYLLRNAFPKCLLEVIHEHHPNCQLNVWGGQYLGLQEPGLQGLLASNMFEFEDPFEMDLLRSPCLHALSTFYNVSRPEPQGFVASCIFPLITMAPNLKHIDLMCLGSRGDEVTKSNQSWGEYIASINPHYTATPLSLNLRGNICNALVQWSKSTDFSSLRAIQLPQWFQPLEVLAPLLRFRNLEYLHISLKRLVGMPHSDFEGDMRSLFGGLNPLKYLRICCPRDTDIIHEIFAHHGRTLRGFILEYAMPGDQQPEDLRPLYPVLNKDDLARLAGNAPCLEEMRLPIRRSLGDKTECELYEALGKFPALRNLILDLDCNPRDSIARDWNQFSEQTPRLSIHDVFINAAMDEKLSKAIWDVIDSSGGGKRMRNLRISVFGLHSLERADGEVARRLARSFLISRYMPCIDAPMKIREIGKEQIKLQTTRQLEYDWDQVLELPKRLQEAIASLWPSKCEEVTWDFEWKGFPLRVE